MKQLSEWANIRDLEALIAVVEERKTTAAAARLGISQPAVSRSISQLEKRLNITLFNHQGSGLAPTAQALAMHEKLVPIFRALKNLHDPTDDSIAPSHLRIATSPTLAHGFLEAFINDFLRKNPQINLSLEITTTPEVLELVADQRADLGVADIIGLSAGLVRMPFRSGQVVCAVPEHHPLAQQSQISPKDLHAQALIMLAKRNAIRPVLERIFNKAGSQPRVVMETATSASAMHFVSLGLGLALLHSYPSTTYCPSNVKLVEFSIPLPYELSFFIARSSVPPVICQQFMDFVRSTQPAKSFQSTPIRKQA
jgi:DNA-binding transcriptional LysR family regulator